MNDLEILTLIKALGDENRIFILKLLQSGELCACKILEKMDILQPTVSYHLKILCDAELLIPRKKGKWTHYRVNIQKIEKLKNFFKNLNFKIEGEKKHD